jgi:hypothetical protein
MQSRNSISVQNVFLKNVYTDAYSYAVQNHIHKNYAFAFQLKF